MLLLGVVTLQGQNTKRAEKYFARAKNEYLNRDPETALRFIRKALQADTGLVRAWLLKAEIAEDMNDTLSAIESYEHFIKSDTLHYPSAYFILGQLYFESGRYKNAATAIEHYLKLEKSPNRYGKKARSLLRQATNAQKIVSHPHPVVFELLSREVNTNNDEYVNFVNEDNTLLYFTRKIPLPPEEQGERQFTEKIFIARNNEGSWSKPELLTFPWNTNMGALSFSVDGRVIYFTGCYLPGGMGSCDIYYSERIGERWLPPHNAGPNINSALWDAQGCLSSDGKTIFFSSKRGGGYGGSDIWFSTRNRYGGWNEPVNAGKRINSTGDEMAPLLFGDNRTLYFSSTGHNGLGGYDLFVSKLDSAGQWSEPENLGVPYNSRYDDINLVIGLDAKSAWITSNRNRPERNFDIFYTQLDQPVQPNPLIYLKGVVLSAKDNKPLDADVLLTDLETGKQLDSTRSDAVNGTFLRVLHPHINYGIHITKRGYLFLSKNLDTRYKNNFQSIRDTFPLQPIDSGSYTNLYNITFDFDKWNLKPEALPELNRLLRFLKENPTVTIRIAGHTDRKGSPAYNLTLSEKRAKAVYDFLTGKGIDPGRLTYTGYGFEQPLCREENETCDAKNRRTEIIIMSFKNP